ncbi:3-phosphoshikimate 1-carboxyvinyltransferase [Micrococcus sp.]|uniref:3-phosphoshikimate 1-carboxyvinyltransferase n=1 Tax=Micrococcus sp. TaxID=1271 RepID=UPI002A911DFB|nr:3-phosphoshikimate 1-carboxyvinyltransferase [Micrococcus sp.]MDY6055073.1 3-phosphoshikimate 1-carboxyvinyltransferase [Micrococcus sp.]
MTQTSSASPAARFPWPDPWPAPAASGPVTGTVSLPGSKSLTNRLLVLAAIAEGPSTLHGVLDSRDARLMRAGLAALGAGFEDRPDGAVVVTPLPVGEPLPELVHVDCGLAGTVMRFLPAVAALRPGTVVIDGDAGARLRPMGPLVSALRQLGVEVQEQGEPGRLPLRLHTPTPRPESGAGTGPAEVAVDAGASSQFLSGLLLSAARRPGGLTVHHTGARVPSPEHVAMTVQTLRKHGVQVQVPQEGVWQVAPGGPAALECRVEPDLSNAGPFLAAAAVTGGTVQVPGWPLETTQIGDRWRQILPRFGAEVELRPDPADPACGVLTVRGGTDTAGRPRVLGAGVLADTAELAPTVAALAMLAEGPTELTGIGHLRGHETDRLAALTAEAARFGVAVEQTEDALAFPGTDGSGPLRAATARTYHDHRMATFAAVVGLRVPGTAVEDVATTGKTIPDFPGMWTALTADGTDGAA